MAKRFISDELRTQIKDLHAQGHHLRVIANLLKVSIYVVSTTVNNKQTAWKKKKEKKGFFDVDKYARKYII